ncbi:hypothetical protein JTB14_011871 [Gonioctena quinquepunctata]|nr:hypothetical protein JTB14_011871 [Gonioctena quinquepunctata]
MIAEPDLPNSSKLASTSSHHPSSKKKYSRISGDLQEQTRDSLEPDLKQYMDLSPVQLFELFFDHKMITFLIEESSRNALFENLPDPNISKAEMKCFIALLIVSGLPGKKSYWESQGDMNNTLVSGAMRRDRFVQIMHVLHCADNCKPNLEDKVWKLRPFINKLNSKYVEHYQPEKHMSYDESMIKYYGRHPCKQFIRGKPISFGYKMWLLNTISGYSVDCELYQGKNCQRSEIYEK